MNPALETVEHPSGIKYLLLWQKPSLISDASGPASLIGYVCSVYPIPIFFLSVSSFRSNPCTRTGRWTLPSDIEEQHQQQHQWYYPSPQYGPSPLPALGGGGQFFPEEESLTGIPRAWAIDDDEDNDNANDVDEVRNASDMKDLFLGKASAVFPSWERLALTAECSEQLWY